MNPPGTPSKLKLIWLLVLVISATLNFFLIQRWISEPKLDSSIPPASIPRNQSNASQHSTGSVAEKEGGQLYWDMVLISDFETLHTRLLAMGCPSHSLRAILKAEIYHIYMPRLRLLFSKQKGDFWTSVYVTGTARRQPPSPTQTAAASRFAELHSEMESLMKKYVGPDWDRESPVAFDISR